eukprot:gene57577-biopygen54867
MGEENAVTLSTAIQQGFERGEVTLAVFADAAGAFDKVDHASLLVKMHRMGVPLQMIKWFKSFLTNRVATVRWGTSESTMHSFVAGAPQGTCCGPVCWLAMGNDFNAADLQFADDQLLWVQAKTIAHCVELMNRKMKDVEKWVKQWRIPLNMDKTMQIVFSPKPKPHPTTTTKIWIKDTTQLGITWREREVLRVEPVSRAHRAGIRQGMHITAIDGEPLGDDGASTARVKEITTGTRAKGSTVTLQLESRPNVRLFGRQVVYTKVCRYLGVLYSEKHNFAEHVQDRLDGFKKRRPILRYLSGTAWGCKKATLRQLYQSYARSYVEYASPAWWPHITQQQIQQLEVQQNHAARAITGCMPRTRIAVLLTECGLRPLALRADEQLVIARERYRRLPDGVPAKAAAEKMRMTERAVQLCNDAAIHGTPVQPMPTVGTLPSWNCNCNVEFYPTPDEKVRRTDELCRKRKVMQQTLRNRGTFDVEIWSDGLTLQFVCSHCDEPDDELQLDELMNGACATMSSAPWWMYNAAADKMAKRGTEMQQDAVPLDLSTVKAAIRAVREQWWLRHLDMELKSSEWEKTGGKHWYREVITDKKGKLRLNTHVRSLVVSQSTA